MLFIIANGIFFSSVIHSGEHIYIHTYASKYIIVNVR